jgi:hypothetical protein
MLLILAQACLVQLPLYRLVANRLGSVLHLVTAGRLGWPVGPPPPEREPADSVNSRRAAPSDPGPFTPKRWLEERHEREHAGERLTRDPRYYVELAGYELEEVNMWTSGGWCVRWLCALLRIAEHFYPPRELKLHRVRSPRRPKRTTAPERGYPILIMHGLFQCSGVFFCNEERSLPFVLAELGYDVCGSLAARLPLMNPAHSRRDQGSATSVASGTPGIKRCQNTTRASGSGVRPLPLHACEAQGSDCHIDIRDLGRDVDEMVDFILAQTSYPQVSEFASRHLAIAEPARSWRTSAIRKATPRPFSPSRAPRSPNSAASSPASLPLRLPSLPDRLSIPSR